MWKIPQSQQCCDSRAWRFGKVQEAQGRITYYYQPMIIIQCKRAVILQQQRCKSPSALIPTGKHLLLNESIGNPIYSPQTLWISTLPTLHFTEHHLSATVALNMTAVPTTEYTCMSVVKVLLVILLEVLSTEVLSTNLPKPHSAAMYSQIIQV